MNDKELQELKAELCGRIERARGLMAGASYTDGYWHGEVIFTQAAGALMAVFAEERARKKDAAEARAKDRTKGFSGTTPDLQI